MKSPYLGVLALTAVVAGLTGAFIGLDRYMAHLESEAHIAAVEARMQRDEPAIEPQLSMALTKYDQWRISAGTVDGGSPTRVLDEVDGGAVDPRGIVSVFVSNDNATCVHVGSCGQGDSDPVDTDTGVEIGTGAGCLDGPSVTFDGRADDLCAQSAGAAVLTRVLVGRQQ